MYTVYVVLYRYNLIFNDFWRAAAAAAAAVDVQHDVLLLWSTAAAIYISAGEIGMRNFLFVWSLMCAI